MTSPIITTSGTSNKNANTLLSHSKLATHAHIVSKWHRNFRKHRKFQLRLNSKDLPPFLHANPDLCMNIKRYGKENLDTLFIEMLSEYIHDKVLLPALVHSTFNEPAALAPPLSIAG